MLQVDQCVQAASVVLTAILLHAAAARRRLTPLFVRPGPSGGAPRGANVRSVLADRLRASSSEERVALLGLCVVLAFVVL
jgi:hypothetical protein